MTPLLALNLRQLILSHLPASGLMLEWGCGGSTAWFLTNMRDEQRLVTIEHDADWLGQCKNLCGEHQRWTRRLTPGSLPIGKNATQWEECSAGLADYVCATEAATADVILIDGIARGACLAWAAMNAKSGACVYLHDVANAKDVDGKPVDRLPWYAWAMNSPRILEPQIVPAATGEYPPSLWCATIK